MAVDIIARGMAGNALSKIENMQPSHKYTSIEKLNKYLYKVTYDEIAEYKDVNDIVIGGCTSFVRDGKLYRNFDYTYDERVAFWVVTKDFEGIAYLNGLTVDNLNDELIDQLPYHIADGCNNDGIRVSEHVLFNDWEYVGSGDKSIPMFMVPYYVLTKLHSFGDTEAIAELTEMLGNLSVPTQLAAVDYLLHFLVTDGNATIAIEPPETAEDIYAIIDIGTNPKLTNFRWIDKTLIDRDDEDLQLRPTGVERWNDVDKGSNLFDLRFTVAYEEPERLSEFIGENDTTKESTDEELTAVYNLAHNAYLTRERDGTTWQTVHSVVYDNYGICSLFIQEDYDKNYVVDLSEYRTAAEQDIIDNHLQAQINNIELGSDVTDVVGTYAELLTYETSKLTANDIIKVLNDETRDNARTYYRWVITASVGTWTYVGTEGATYTKAEMDDMLEDKQDTLTAGTNLEFDGDTLNCTAGGNIIQDPLHPTRGKVVPTTNATVVTILGPTSTDADVPSAKCVYDAIVGAIGGAY